MTNEEFTPNKIAEHIIKSLKPYRPYIHKEAMTGSIYIKFPNWKLGSIRIGDHDGRIKYTYRWRIRTDNKLLVNRGVHKGVNFLECGTERLDILIDTFKAEAIMRAVKPGSKEVFNGKKTT